jgi:hypothetical protein
MKTERGGRRRLSSRLYKVLIDGQSCHGGTMTWSLPVATSLVRVAAMGEGMRDSREVTS